MKREIKKIIKQLNKESRRKLSRQFTEYHWREVCMLILLAEELEKQLSSYLTNR